MKTIDYATTTKSRRHTAKLIKRPALDTLGRSNENKRGPRNNKKEMCRQAHLNHLAATWLRDNGYANYKRADILTPIELEAVLIGRGMA